MTEPILVTGSHRSGTTWVGRMLAASGEAGYVHEPFNPRRRPGWTGDRIPYWYLYVDEHNEDVYLPVVRDVLRFHYPLRSNLRVLASPRGVAIGAPDLARSIVYRRKGLRPLLKDPIALFSAPWLARRFDARVVVMIRHPAGFVSSIARLGWQFRFRSWLAQPRLVATYFPDLAADMRRCWAGDGDIVDQGIVMWNAIHRVIDRYRAEHPGWRFVRHEDLAAEPLAGFEDLYRHAGLAWNEDARRAVIASTTGGSERSHRSVRRDSRAQASSWRSRLGAPELERIVAGTEEVARRFYSPEELA